MQSEFGRPNPENESQDLEELLPQAQDALDEYYIKAALGIEDSGAESQEMLFDNFIRTYLGGKGVPSHLYDSVENHKRLYHLVGETMQDLDDQTGVVKLKILVRSKFTDENDNYEILFDDVVKTRVSKKALETVKKTQEDREIQSKLEQEEFERKKQEDFAKFLPYALEHLGEQLTPEDWLQHGMPDSAWGPMPESSHWDIEKAANNRLIIRYWYSNPGTPWETRLRDVYEYNLPTN